MLTLIVAASAIVATSAIAADYTISNVPIDVAETAEPNVMLLMDTSGSMGSRPSGYSFGKTKMEQAISAATAVIQAGDGMRIGLARLNRTDGGRIDLACGSNETDLLDRLDEYEADGSTPIAEAYYEVTRYFRGMKGHFSHKKSKYTSPITSQCQKNFTVVVTDGKPQYDGDFSNINDPDAGSRLPNWDDSDDDTQEDWGYSNYYLDDLAMFGWDIDMSDQPGLQNMYTYTIGFDINLDMLEDAAENGHGEYLIAGNEDELLTSLRSIFADISRKSFSNTRLSANSGYVSSGLDIYQASFNTTDWSGELNAYSTTVNSSTGLLEVSDTPSWEAAEELLTPASRVILTNRGNSALAFRWSSFTNDEKNEWFSEHENQLNYIRGDDVSGYRSRNSLLGDIVHSNPIYVASPSAYYSSSSYRTFKETYSAREPMIYVGANDGMLHGFRASDGEELLAYIPSILLPELKDLADPEYSHRYYVDGTPTVQDAYVRDGNGDGEWRTLLAGGLNAGGQGVYLLDVTDPSNFSESEADDIFLREFTDADDQDMGYSYARPAIVKLKDNQWYLVFGNGYNNTVDDDHVSESGDAVIYLQGLDSGSSLIKLSTNIGLDEAPEGLDRPNGMSTLAPVSDDGQTVNVIYGGDLYGNVWKFDLNSADPAEWALDYKVFQACTATSCHADEIQPITSRLAVAENSFGDNMIYFGTGKDFEFSDKSSTSLQTFYGIVDEGAEISLGRDALQEQTIDAQGFYSFGDESRELRLTSDNSLGDNDKGWYMDLETPHSSGVADQLGERVLSTPVLRGSRVIFSTLTYTNDPCEAGGYGWEMELNRYTGSRLSYVSVDYNGDEVFDENDKVTDADGTKVSVSGMRAGNGTGVTELVDGDGLQRIHNDDELDSELVQSAPEETGRASWRYLERN
ncbi:PilC/PilY family type IV pilus protein [Amphritea sp. 2_MG-2023]|nr:PilC/PilY family type IV pilus protein [Amphritea sp. 2_MG-2023]MBU2963984.1 VWA domain-containing protein [Amphritea atlantica]MDO6420312.1 PilC/PilY family type IV pilus protein [Amphritea sp. 2_MG-2023]